MAAIRIIIDKTPNYIVASRYIWPGYSVVLINIDTGNAVWSRTGLVIGMSGETMYLQCQ